MAAEQPNNIKKPLCAGLLAHVDAGKTTLSEAMLYEAGARRTLGRVDHQDAFLDTHALERARGITIFSKQALLETEHRAVTLVDTPGHVDFSAEAERIMPVLDCAVLVISGTDGVQAHTLTLWRLLERYQVPTFLFLNKMDLPGMGKEKLLAELRQQLSPACVDFTASPEEIAENAAMCDEALLENYLETGGVTAGNLRALIAGRKLFPCCFGSGLKLDGVGTLLDILDKYAPETAYPGEFAAKVYKISRDPQGNRLTWLKVTGGSLKVRSALRYVNQKNEPREEKIVQLRRYSADKFTAPEEVAAGQLAAVTGLSETYAGQSLGAEPAGQPYVLEPVMTYRVNLPGGADPGAGPAQAAAAGGRGTPAASALGKRTDPRTDDGAGAAGGFPQSGAAALRSGRDPQRPADLSTRKPSKTRWRASGILSRCATMPRCICCWSRCPPAAVWCSTPYVPRTCWMSIISGSS